MKISPAKLDFEGVVDEKSCSYIQIKSDRIVNLSIFLNSSEDLNFKGMNLNINNFSWVSLCISAESPGEYNGNLSFLDSEGRSEIKIPFAFNVGESENGFGITGFAISDIVEEINWIWLMSGIIIIEIILLSYLLSKLIRKV